jgi:hypothetical protein
MLFMDNVSAKTDRHTNKFGLLRDIKSGNLFGFAPIYNNNMALISRGCPSKAKLKDFLMNLFNELIEKSCHFSG